MYGLKTNLVLLFSLLVLSLSACAPAAPAAQAVDLPLIQPPQPAAEDVIPNQIKVATMQPGLETLTPTEPAMEAEAPNQPNPAFLGEESLTGGYVLFDREAGEFLTYARDGSLLYTSPAPDIQYPTPWSMSIVHNAVYYRTDESRHIYRTSANGVEETAIPFENLTDFSVSPDEKRVAWSTLHPRTGVSEFWTANLDGSDATLVDSLSPSGPVETLYFYLIGWTPDGKLLFDEMPTGLGGYILYMGNVNLFSYDPLSGQTEEIYRDPESESPGRLCVETLREDLNKLVLSCDGDQRVMTILGLADGSKVNLPKLEGQGVAGSAEYSPSGQWLAYAIAAGDWENENGKVVVVPTDLSQGPLAITAVAGKSYPYVVGWLDEETILFTRNQDSETTLWKIKVDGEDLTQVAEGAWMGWIP